MTDAVTAATARNTAAVEGDEPGQYTAAVKATYAAAIATAEAAAAKTDATEADLKAATAALATATATFVAAVNPEVEEVAEIEFTATTIDSKDAGVAGLAIFNITGTVAGTKAADVASVKLVFDAGVPAQDATYDATTKTFSYKDTFIDVETVTVEAYNAAGVKVASEAIKVSK